MNNQTSKQHINPSSLGRGHKCCPFTHLSYVLPFENFTFGDDHERAKDTVHLPCASTHAVAETAAQIVSPAVEGTLGPLLKFS